jgi:hypothetical protein
LFWYPVEIPHRHQPLWSAGHKQKEGKTETSFILPTIFNLVMNVLYTFVALVVGILALRFIDLKLLTEVDIQAELKENNLAVSIFASTVLIFVSMIVSFGLKG